MPTLNLSQRELEILDVALALSLQDGRAGEYLLDHREKVEGMRSKTHQLRQTRLRGDA